MRQGSENFTMTASGKNNWGFTILELLFVMTIISILAMVAIPAYMQYTVRTKVSEALEFAAMAKTSVVDAYNSKGYVFPIDNSEAGLGLPADYSNSYVQSLSVGTSPTDGTITVTMNLAEMGTDNRLQFVPGVDSGIVVWTCQAAATNGISDAYLPSNCR